MRLIRQLFIHFYLYYSAGGAHVIMYVFTSPSTRAGCDTMLIFKQSLKGLESELFFSYTCLTKAKEIGLSYYLPIGKELDSYLSQKISDMWNAFSLIQDLNTCRRIYFQGR